MNIFVPYQSPLETAKCLDPRRLSSQIRECKLIINSIIGEGPGRGWDKHPISKMYKNHLEWIVCYLNVLAYYRSSIQSAHVIKNLDELIRDYDNAAKQSTPSFLTDGFCNQHKRRLYTKNPEHYKQFSKYGKSEENWYVIDDKIIKYINGKIVK